MKVSEVIEGQELVSAKLESTIGEIAELMKKHHVTGVPIVDDWGVLAGLVTSGIVMDMARAWAPRQHHEDMPIDHSWGSTREPMAPLFQWTDLQAKDAMTSDLCTVGHDDEVVEAALAMVARGVHRAIVLGTDRNVKGVISSLDFVRLTAEGRLRG